MHINSLVFGGGYGLVDLWRKVQGSLHKNCQANNIFYIGLDINKYCSIIWELGNRNKVGYNAVLLAASIYGQSAVCGLDTFN